MDIDNMFVFFSSRLQHTPRRAGRVRVLNEKHALVLVGEGGRGQVCVAFITGVHSK